MTKGLHSKSAVSGAAVALVGALAILGASFGLKAFGDARSDDSEQSRGAAAGDLDFFDSEYCIKSLMTRVEFDNQLPVGVTIVSVTDIDTFDWCNSAAGDVLLLPTDSAQQRWGLTGLVLAPASTITRQIEPRATSSGSPFSLSLVSAAGEALGIANLDVNTLDNERGRIVFRGDELAVLTDYRQEKAIGAMIVDGQARLVLASVATRGWESVVTFRVG
ncbi:unannotated protein [freshwater metagenome]|uniref:Unannotated protein n=1 Tax=freshwater metagenome TaxID=449393 RepID=A0A6J6IDL1_9ZZZZ|nr:hypothetical protein [Actinomycetota bacterium]